MTVYVILRGEYEDTEIVAVTDDPKSAENLRILYSSEWGEAYIESFELQNLQERPKTCWSVRQGMISWCNEVPVVDSVGKKKELNKVEVIYSATGYSLLVYVDAINRNDAKSIAEKLFEKVRMKP